LSDLDRLPARQVFAYGVGCVEQHALELASAIDVSLISVEAYLGGGALRNRMQRRIRRMLGEATQPVLSADEQAAIAEVEREIARDFPFYMDEARLNEVHERLGRLKLG
jgi:hypothetical protein